MRYTNGAEWVEIAGANALPMRQLDALYTANMAEAFAIAAGVVKDWLFVVQGTEVPVGDVAGLTLRQWDWLRSRILTAARDEEIDPEA